MCVRKKMRKTREGDKPPKQSSISPLAALESATTPSGACMVADDILLEKKKKKEIAGKALSPIVVDDRPINKPPRCPNAEAFPVQ